MADGFRRRTVISVVASGVVLGAAGCPSSSSPAEHAFFSAHEAAVVENATARIAPGPADDPAEAGHPGAREARVTQYIDAMLGALSSAGSLAADEPAAPVVFAGGPWSNRHTSGPDLMTMFIPLDPVTVIAWRKRLSGWQRQYRQGIAALDKLAGGGLHTVDAAQQD